MGLSFPVENPSQHIPLPCVVRSAALVQGHRMVHTGSASTQEAVLIPSAAASPTFPTCALLNGFKVKDKNVIVVVGRLILQHRHRQLPVSAAFLGRGFHMPLVSLLYRMDARFQVTSPSQSSRLTRCAALQPPVWSRWISLQGPRGPVSLISQKLSSM